MAPGWAIDRFASIDAADDVADVAAIDQKLVGFLYRAPICPRDKARRAHHDRREQPVVRVGHPARLAVDAARIHEPVGLVEVDDVRDVDEARGPPSDPGARLVATDD